MNPGAGKIDTVVIGGSAGAFGVLRTILGQLPADLDAVVLVALHRGTTEIEGLAHLLRRFTELETAEATDGAPLCPGRILFAPTDQHLLIGDGHVHLRCGPTENGFRPAIDPLFRSAAVYRPTRTIGVILSGRLDDGASGLRAIDRVGGIAVVQDPDDAPAADMPTAAKRAVPGAEQRDANGLAAFVRDVVGRPAGSSTAPPADVVTELTIAALEESSMRAADSLGELSPYNCPDCNGVLWEISDGHLTRYRCHTGHAYTEATLAHSQATGLERSLQDSLRAQRGHASLLRRMAGRPGSERLADHLIQRAERHEADSRLLEQALHRRWAHQP